MLNIGPAELLVVLVVALLVLGPNKLPDAARQVGRAIGEMRRLSSGFQSEMRDALREPVEGKPTSAKSSSKAAASGGTLASPRAPGGDVPEVPPAPAPEDHNGRAGKPSAPSAPEGGSVPTTSEGDAKAARSTGDAFDAPAEAGNDGATTT